MGAFVKKSVLNPLATCFVPSNLKAISEGSAVVSVTAMKTITKELKTVDNINGNSNKRQNYNLGTAELARITKIFCDETEDKLNDKEKLKSEKVIDYRTMVLIRIPSFISSFPNAWNELLPYKTVAFGIFNIILLSVVKLIHSEPSIYNGCAQVSEVPAIEESECKDKEECLCPPMFGWVIPPTFFGNPLKLKYDCSKNYVHSPKYIGNDRNTSIRTSRSLEGKKKQNSGSDYVWDEGEKTLEQYSLEFQMIIRDVCDSVREETLSDFDAKEFQDYSEFSDELQNESYEEKEVNVEKSVWNSTTVNETSNDEQIIDDGSHPLLQSMSLKNCDEDEEVRESIEFVENILEKCLLPGKESEPFDGETSTTKIICSPPCSVWCEYLPSAAKDTFKRFLKSRKHVDSNTEIGTAYNSIGERPSYKRSFSEGDAPMYANPCQDFTSFTSARECRERLMMLRKNPVAYFRNQTDTLGEEKLYRSSHSDLSNCQLRENCLSTPSSETSWGQFDGADSLWKPLPDCVPSNECNQKPSHKKAREMRRQRSVN